MTVTNLFYNLASVGILWFALYAILNSRTMKSFLIIVLGIACAAIAFAVLQSYDSDIVKVVETIIGVPLAIALIIMFIVQLVHKRYKEAGILLFSSVYGVITISSHYVYLVMIGYLFAFAIIYILYKPLKIKIKKGRDTNE